MVFDTLAWGEVTQNNGLAGVAAVTGFAPYTASGDTYKMPARRYLVGLAGTSLTKPNGCAVSGDKSRGAQRFHANAAISMGFNEILKDFALEFEDQELVTAVLSNTNVSEESQVVGVFTENPHPWPHSIWEAAQMGGVKWPKIHVPRASVTVATTKTAFNGEVALDTAITNGAAGQNTGWLSTDKEYVILGFNHSVATTAFGTVYIRGLSGEWQGRMPGTPMYGPLLATFDNPIGTFMPLYEPVPFKGNSLPLISEMGLVAAAHTFGVVIGEK